MLRLQQWSPGFDLFKQKISITQLWTRFHRLPWELWDPQLLCDIASKIGTLVRIDCVTLDKDFGHYARVLIEVDLASTLQYQLFLNCQGIMYDFEIVYENLPLFCSLYHTIGHDISSRH